MEWVYYKAGEDNEGLAS
jgi:hypothetical protein